MERKKVSLSLKAGAAKKRSKDSSINAITPEYGNQKKSILKNSTSNKANLFGSPLSKSGSYLSTPEKFHTDNFDFHCLFETNCTSEQEIDIPCTQAVSHDKILEGVVAFIEVRSDSENRFEGISKQVEMLGATVVKKFTPEVTHVIFKDGKKTTRERALKKGIHLVSVLWVESCRQSGKHVSEDLFPVVLPEEATTPLMVGRLKRTKSMQPKAFEEDVQNSADRGERRRKRKLKAENLTLSAVVFCEETQDPNTPIFVNPPMTPHMVPDTPCHKVENSPPFTKALTYDGDSPKEPIASDKDDIDQSPDSSQDIPSSIRKLKRRLLSKSTPTRLLTPPPEQKKTPAAQTRKTPKDVLLTGSEQGKKRKRQDSAKEAHNDDAKEAAVKDKKKARLAGIFQCDDKSKEEPKMNTVGTKRGQENVPVAKKGGKDNISEEIDDEKIATAIDDGKKNRASVPAKKKAQVKRSKKLPPGSSSDQDCEDLNSDSGVSVTDGNSKPSIVDNASLRHKKFSKTAKLAGQVEKPEEFDDSVVTQENGVIRQQNSSNAKMGANEAKTKKNPKQGKPVKQVKLVSQEKLVDEVSKGKSKEEDGTVNKSSVMKENGENTKSERLSSDETRSEDEDTNEEGDTCTEEDEQECRIESEGRTERKQRAKLVKKVKPKRSVVMTSMHFGEQDIVLSVVRKLGGFFIEDRVSPSTSHVIAGSPRRTLNVLMAIAQGCWLVSPVWMMKSLEVGYWVDEEPYELSDTFPAAQLCRLERVSAGPGYRRELFVECPPIFVSENCSPPSDSLMSLINLCGGKVSTSVRKAGICIGSMTGRTQAVNVTEQWILDCITQHAVLPYASYALNSPAKRRRETSPSY